MDSAYDFMNKNSSASFYDWASEFRYNVMWNHIWIQGMPRFQMQMVACVSAKHETLLLVKNENLNVRLKIWTFKFAVNRDSSPCWSWKSRFSSQVQVWSRSLRFYQSGLLQAEARALEGPTFTRVRLTPALARCGSHTVDTDGCVQSYSYIQKQCWCPKAEHMHLKVCKVCAFWLALSCCRVRGMK